MPAPSRPTPETFLLVVDGVRLGAVRRFEGGGVSAEVLVEEVRGSSTRKRLGTVRYEPFVLRLDFPPDKHLAEWIRQTWLGVDARRSGAVVVTDHNLKPISERQFTQAAITGITIPTLDAASKETGYFAIELTPATAQLKKPSGQSVPGAATSQNRWLPSNFRLEIDGVDCKRVSKIDAFTMKLPTAPHQTRLDFPNLRITLSESGAETWLAWHRKFVIDGDNGPNREKSGVLTFLAPNRQDALSELRFTGLGIFRLAPVPRAPGSEQVAQLVADLYCERMDLTVRP